MPSHSKYFGRQLDSLVAEMFSSLSRSDQRAKAAPYTRGVMIDGRRAPQSCERGELGDKAANGFGEQFDVALAADLVVAVDEGWRHDDQNRWVKSGIPKRDTCVLRRVRTG
jgi:hypothetical protein